jgi:hypothetical protein
METSIAMFWGGWGKASCANIQSSGATIPGPCTVTKRPLTRHLLWGSFWLQREWQSSSTLPTHQTSPSVSFSYFRKWNWSSKVDVFRSLNRSRPNSRTWWRCWCKVISKRIPDHGNPAGIAVLTQKGTTSKEMEANKNFSKCLSLGRRISGTFW